KQLGPDATFEQRQDAAAAIASDALWWHTDQNLREAITTADEVEVEGRQYSRLEQASSAIYYGQWGRHPIEETLYREVAVHNGSTIKPIELRVGIIEHMTPDMARVVGELSAGQSSRGVEKTLLLRDDNAIDTIWRKLRRLAETLPGRGTDARNAVAAAL